MLTNSKFNLQKHKNLFFNLLVLTIGSISLWSCAKDKLESNDFGIKHVVVIGFDGLSPDGINHAKTPTFDRIIKEGASTMHARAVLPTSSSANWASMIMGAGPVQHGITSNDWKRNNFLLPAVVQSEKFLFPTILNLIATQKQNTEIGAIYHWGGFGRLFEKSAVTFDENTKTEYETADVASGYISEKKPDFAFIHFDHVDHAGHKFGHGSDEYYASVEKADSLLAQIMTVIEEGPLSKKTLVIISSDHGGLGKGHGGASLSEIEIPFLLWGPNVKKNHTITTPVYQYDNAATVAFALGLQQPQAWIGKPVKEAFNGFAPTDLYPLKEWLVPPQILPKGSGYKQDGGLFKTSSTIKFKNANASGEIRYTTDGELPTAKSKLYKDSLLLEENKVIKAAIFENQKMRSMVSTAFVRVIPKSTQPVIKFELFYMKDLSFLPSLQNKVPNLSGKVYEFTSAEVEEYIKDNTVVRFSAQLTIEKANDYTFYTRSDDGSKLMIDREVVVDNDGHHGVREKDGSIYLDKGIHEIKVLWFNGGGDGWLDVYVESSKLDKQILPTTMLLN